MKAVMDLSHVLRMPRHHVHEHLGAPITPWWPAWTCRVETLVRRGMGSCADRHALRIPVIRPGDQLAVVRALARHSGLSRRSVVPRQIG